MGDAWCESLYCGCRGIHQAFVSPSQGGGTRHYELAKYLVELGYQVTIITSDTDYLQLIFTVIILLNLKGLDFCKEFKKTEEVNINQIK